MSYTIFWCYLWVFIRETMADGVEGIASRLGPPVEQVAFPVDVTRRAQMTMGARTT